MKCVPNVMLFRCSTASHACAPTLAPTSALPSFNVLRGAQTMLQCTPCSAHTAVCRALVGALHRVTPASTRSCTVHSVGRVPQQHRVLSPG